MIKSLVVLIIYFLHWYLSAKTNLSKRIKFLNSYWFRYLWNLILLLTFILSAISGVFLYLGYRSRGLISIHNQWGIIMIEVGFLHLLARIKYFLK